jgi:hypothetical protein
LAELSNETVEELISVLRKRSGGGGDNDGKKPNETAKGLGDAAIKTTGDLVKFGGTVFSSGAKLSDSYEAASKAMGNFGGALLGPTSAFSQIAKEANGFGAAIIKAAESGVDTFRNLSGSGASFNNNILEMKNSAAQSRLTLDEFAGIVSNNTKGFAAFGGTVTKGAKTFTSASKDLFDTGLATPLLNMGMTFEDVNEDLAEYIVANRRRFTADQIAQGAANKSFALMATEMDKVAKLTGQNRKELEKETNDRMRKGQVDAKIRQLEASGNKEAADKMRMALAQAAKAGPGTLAAVEDLFTKGTVVSEEGRQAAVALGPAFKDLTNMVSYAKGPGGVEGMTNSISNFNTAVSERINDPNFLRIATLGGMGNATADAAAQMVSSAGTYADNVKALMDKEGISREAAVKKLSELAEKEQKARDPVTSTVVNGEKALRDLGAVINEKLIGQGGAVTKLSTALEGTAKTLETLDRPDMTVGTDEFLSKLSNYVPGTTGSVESTKSYPDINISEETQKKIQATLNSLQNNLDVQKGEKQDFASIVQTTLGPDFINTLQAMADKQGKSYEQLVGEISTSGSDEQFKKIAMSLFKEKNKDASPAQLRAFEQSIDMGRKVDPNELINQARVNVDEMTVTKMNIPGKEFGGPVQKDQAYVVGEKRAELFVPQQNGHIVPSIKNLEASMKQVKKPMQQMQGIDTSGLEATMREFATNMESALQKSGAQDSMKEIAEQISNSMGNVTGELMKGNKVAARQLKGISGLSGNLFKGL